MKFTEGIFNRATVRGIVDYLLYGESLNEEDRDYERRMKEAYKKYDEMLLEYNIDHNSELNDVTNALVSEASSVYAEIGLQTGYLILLDMYKNMALDKDLQEIELPMVDYQKMYESISCDVSIALDFLQISGDESVRKAETVLKAAQFKAVKKLQVRHY